MKSEMKLLIVDDDADDRNLFIESIKEVDESLECMIATNGEQALKILRDKEHELPDFIFLDLRMPRIDGKRCLYEIKSEDRLKNIPVVIFTTSTDVNDSRELREMGAFHFMSKPNDPEEIYYLISFVLEAQFNACRRS
ncbi:MAG: response regulator [Chitinophagaceae bacterium]